MGIPSTKYPIAHSSSLTRWYSSATVSLGSRQAFANMVLAALLYLIPSLFACSASRMICCIAYFVDAEMLRRRLGGGGGGVGSSREKGKGSFGRGGRGHT